MQKIACKLEFFENHSHWPQVKAVYERLTSHGFSALLAGGCVRDLVMKTSPKDFDIATNATPDQLVQIFPKALSVGRDFGVIILAFETFQIEIASFRTDGPYLDGRRPSSVSFTNAEQDALRRDFSVNALFLDIKSSQIIDYVEGLKDIEHKIIRAVGDPMRRFTEDRLRMLRAIRFSSQLNFTIESATFKAIEQEHDKITMVSFERIRDELIKLLETKAIIRGFGALKSSGLLGSIHPQFREFLQDKNFQKIGDIFSQDLSGLNILTKLCILFAPRVQSNHEDEYFKLKQLLKDLRFSSEQVQVVDWTIRNYFKLRALKKQPLRLAEEIKILANRNFQILNEFFKAYDPLLFKEVSPDLQNLRLEYLKKGQLPDAFLNGDDLKLLGMKPGHQLGQLLGELFNLQIEKKILSREQALEFAKKNILHQLK